MKHGNISSVFKGLNCRNKWRSGWFLIACLCRLSGDRHSDPRERQDLHQSAEAEGSRGADQEARGGGGQSRERKEGQGAEREGQVVTPLFFF